MVYSNLSMEKVGVIFLGRPFQPSAANNLIEITFFSISETLLTDSECPQEVRLAARGKPCMLAYKRIEAKIAWPTTSSAF